jgi:hypothetical protein
MIFGGPQYFFFLVTLLSMWAYLKYENVGGFEETHKNYINALEKRHQRLQEKFIVREQRQKMEILLDTYKDVHKFKIPKLEKKIEKAKKDSPKIEQYEKNSKKESNKSSEESKKMFSSKRIYVGTNKQNISGS